MTIADLYPNADPSLLLDFANVKALDPSVTFTRNSVGTYWDRSGVLRIAAANRPRFDHDPITLESRGLLVEQSATNLLDYSEQFDNAAWTKDNSTVTANAAVAPSGATTADAIVWASATNPEVRSTAKTIQAGSPITLSVYAKANTKSSLSLIAFNDGSNYVEIIFNLATGAVSSQSVTGTRYTSVATSITDVGDGWFRCALSANTNTLTSMAAWIRANTAAASGDSIFIWGAQLETDSTATTYQRVVSQYDVTEAGVPTLHYLSFDGTDDFMVTSTIAPNTDKVQVFAGVRKLSDTSIQCLYEFSAAFGSNAGSFVALPSYDGNTGFGAYWFATSRGSTVIYGARSTASYPAPQTVIHTQLANIGGDESTLRINGTQAGQSAADQGTGNFLSYPLYIGRRGGTSLPFNGHLYGLIVRFGSNLNTPTIQRTEAILGIKCGFNWNNLISTTVYDRSDTTILDRAGNTIMERT